MQRFVVAVALVSLCLTSSDAAEIAVMPSVGGPQFNEPALERVKAESFAGYGVLARGPSSCLIIFHADDGRVFVLDDYGDFFWGDRVYVTGTINADSTACWPVIQDAIEDNTIVECFEGVGTLGRGPQNCIVVFHADDGRTFVLDDYGDFWWGDRVYVTGAVDAGSFACWPASQQAIEDNTIVECFEGCGTIGRGPQNCTLMFFADDGRAFVLDDYGDFLWNDRVYVTGAVNLDSLACWPAVQDAIENNTIVECFEGCGTLGIGPQNCTLMFFSDDGRGFALDDYGDFLWQDRVYVTGPVNLDSLACWPVVADAINDNTVEACEE